MTNRQTNSSDDNVVNSLITLLERRQNVDKTIFLIQAVEALLKSALMANSNIFPTAETMEKTPIFEIIKSLTNRLDVESKKIFGDSTTAIQHQATSLTSKALQSVHRKWLLTALDVTREIILSQQS